MEDDDEFGDLYTDVLRPLEVKSQPPAQQNATAAAAGKPPPQARPVDLNIDSDDEEILYGAPDSNLRSNSNRGSAPGWNSNASIRDETLAGPRGIDLNLDSNTGAARIDGIGGKGFEARVLEKGIGPELGGKASVKSNLMEDEDDINIIVEEREDKDGDLVENDDNLTSKEENNMSFVKNVAAGEMSQQMIPGLSGRLENTGAPNIEDEWESDESDDDLQIVLNDNNHGPMGMERMAGMVDEDDEDGEPLVIVADNGDVGHHHLQTQRMADEQEWGGEEGASRADGEKDTVEATKASGGGVGAAPAAAQPKIAYSNHAFHHPFSSQFKYVRPGAAPLPPGGIPGQVRPPISMGPPAGRGRGDWRPAGMKGALPMQKGFHPGYGTPGGAAGRGYGSGLDFTLPSHKTIFEVDIDSFEEKPWKLPGIDVSDFFNFGLNEDSWRDYCKQLEQLRLEMTMQSKIRVYESGRAEQDYDPDLPPELAAAVGIQDNNISQTLNHGKSDAGPTDLERAAAREWPPHRKPIPVEAGSGDRLPSVDTRRPRIPDMDVVIVINCHSSMDGDDTSEQDNDPARKQHMEAGDEADDLQQGDADHMDSYSPAYNGNQREFESRRPQSKNTVYNDGIARKDVSRLPSEVADDSHSDREIDVPQERSTKGRSNVTAPENKGEPIAGDLKEDSYHTGDGKQSPAQSFSHSIGSDNERVAVVGDENNDDSVVDDRSLNIEREELGSDAPRGAHDDKNTYSTKKQKLSSQIPQEFEDGKDSKAARSGDSKARSGSSEHRQSSRDDVDNEVLQNRYPLRAGRDAGDDDNVRRKDHYDREEGGRQNTVVKGREDSFSRRGVDVNSSLHRHGKAESADWRRDSDISGGTWNRRDEDHRGRRTRLEDPRTREPGRVRSRSRDMFREKEKSERDEHHQSRNQLDSSSWRGANHEYDATGSRQRDRDDHLKNRSERVDDLHSTRRKEESHMRRTHSEKGEISHNHRESSTRRKRERDDSSDQLKRDDRGRSKDDDLHYARQKEGGSSQRERSERPRERDEWHKSKQDDLLSKRERVETRPVMRGGRAADEKWASHSRGNDEYKGSSREYHPKDIGRHSDQPKQRDRVESESFSQRRSHEDVYARGSQINNDEKRTKYEKTSSRNDRSAYGSDTSRAHEYKKKETSRKGKESDSGDQSSLIPSENQDEDGGPTNEAANLKSKTEQHSGHGHGNHQPSRKHKEEISTDDELPDSRRGRSKLERWTSHKERDFAATPTPSSSKKRDRDTHTSRGASSLTVPTEEPSEKTEDKRQPSVDTKDTGPETNNDTTITKAVEDKHLDTVAKLKKRSERFKLPMPSEKDAVAVKKMESEPLPPGQPETHPDSEIKSERPARKRRWTGN